MDIVLEVMDTLAFDKFWATVAPLNVPGNQTFTPPNYPTFFTMTQPKLFSSIPRDNLFRQFASLWFITWIFGVITYFLFSSLSYFFIFYKTYLQHPKFLANQIRKEISLTMYAMPVMAIFTAPWFLTEVRGYSRLYMQPDKYGWFYFAFQFPLFLVFTDGLIYYIHRLLHHPSIYKTYHKPHHRWIVPTPFASHAFHPLDGYSQSVPYHLFPFIFPLQKFAYLALFVFINVWTILIHDGEYIASHPLINGAANHAHHHLHFNYNYGQFFTFFDRLGGTYRMPDGEMFDAEKKNSKDTWERQIAEMVVTQGVVEGDDEREYANDAKTKKEK